MFKTHLLLIALVGLICQANGQKDTDVLLTVAKTPVTVGEFKYIYEKNNRDQADYSPANVSEYLDLYTNFKLKVQKARDLKYDQSEAYQAELAGYRAQLADSYVIDKEVVSQMIDQISERQQWDVELEHLLISTARKANIKSQQQAKQKIEAISKEIAGGLSFERAVQKYSLDRESAQQDGYIGFVNAPLPDGYFELEDAVYQLQPGQISKPIRTDMGYHIVRVLSKRPARGQMNVQHLLVRNERNKIKIADALPRAQRIHRQIKDGEITFEQAVRQYSEDQATKTSMGNLGTISIGQYDPAFEDGVFALEADGDISEPIETSIGYHIIRRVSKKPMLQKEAISTRIKTQPRTTERFTVVHRKVVDDIKQAAKFKEARPALISWAQQLDQSFYTYRWQPEADQQKIFSFGQQEYTIDDFVVYAKKQNKKRMQAQDTKPIVDAVLALYDDFIGEKAIAYAETQLERTYPEFNNLMREYREGILLFDVTKDFVWDKASADTAAIRRYFDAHTDLYQWEERAVVTNYSITTAKQNQVAPIILAAKSMTPQELQGKFNTPEKEMVLYSQETLEKSSKTLKDMDWQVDHVSKPIIQTRLKMTTFKKIEKIIPARPKSLKEAKGYVISDYQDQLDKEWIKKLREEYKVKINKKVLKKLTSS